MPELARPPAALPALLGASLSRARALVRRLPTEPPSLLAALALDRLLLPRLDATQRKELAGRVVEVEIVEAGLRVRLRLDEAGAFRVVRGSASAAPAAVRIRAQGEALWRLLRGQDDADRLFFERALVTEGDTEYGLVIKNTLDAIGPLLPG